MNKKRKVMLVFGTRPEAIKMAPVVQAFREERDAFEVKVCVTAQHRQMLDQVLNFFNITPDIDLNLMKDDQTLSGLTADAVRELSLVIEREKPSMVLVQGDTTTAFVGALASFYNRVAVGHVEAGLRTNDIYAPFPEEVNRRLISVVATHHYAPTERAAAALKSENVDKNAVHVTGNTVVDALMQGLKIIEGDGTMKSRLEKWFASRVSMADAVSSKTARLILITGHRRESFGEGFRSICRAIGELSRRYPSDAFVYPVHLNPNVQRPVFETLSSLKNVFLIDPVEYAEMLYLFSKAYLVLTDSGGVQEEVPSLKIPVVIMREKTERPELVELGGGILVGCGEVRIVKETTALLDGDEYYRRMQIGQNPFGDGQAGRRIVAIINGAKL